MQAPTHAVFSLVFVILAGTVVGILLTPAVATYLDTPTSVIGKACLPLSRFLERRFGHRTITHSFLGLVLSTLPLLPLWILNPQWPLAFALGYLSHLVVDCANKSGTPLFYRPRGGSTRSGPGRRRTFTRTASAPTRAGRSRFAPARSP